MSSARHSHPSFSYGRLPLRGNLTATVVAAAIWLGLVFTVTVTAPGLERSQDTQAGIPTEGVDRFRLILRTSAVVRPHLDQVEPASVDDTGPHGCEPRRG